ncbi:MAG: peptide ABC transporter substrate-binding protein [Anaerorhabdus sp.]
MKLLKKSLVLLLALVLIAGCQSAPEKEPNETGGTTEEKNSVTIATDTDIQTMDLSLATDGTSFVAINLGFAGLVEMDANNQPIPDIAKSWEVNEDKTKYVFNLVDTAWSNGESVTAHDFVYSWRRLLDPSVASEYAFIMSVVGVKNASAVNSGEMAPEELGVVALDDKTLEVTLDKPCDFFLGLLAFPSFFPLNEKFVEEQGDQYATSVDKMLYSGPYVMESWIPGNGYEFVRNEGYFNPEAAPMDNVNFRFIQDSQTAMLEYQSGNIDVVKLSGEMVDAYSSDPGFTTRLQGYLWYLSMNFEVETLQNNKLRHAISYAVDRETIATLVLKDGSVAAKGIIPIVLATGPDGKDFRDSVGELVSYDPEKAAELYEEAKAELGSDVTLELLFEDTEASKAVAEYIQSNLETNLPGMTVTLNSKPKKTRLQLQQNQEYEVALHRWGPDYSDPQTYLDLFLTGSVNNYGKYESEEYMNLMMEATEGETATDSSARWELLKQAEELLIKEDMAVVPVYQNGGAVMINPVIEGIEFHSAGIDNYRHIKLK